mmetsp:Transcript_15578/g.30583  ORF Transcript_15578/g.30583 Transcript_15578/m.30583 type:complete len:215 (+) Transcript_15578:910-1554(+)
MAQVTPLCCADQEGQLFSRGPDQSTEVVPLIVTPYTCAVLVGAVHRVEEPSSADVLRLVPRSQSLPHTHQMVEEISRKVLPEKYLFGRYQRVGVGVRVWADQSPSPCELLGEDTQVRVQQLHLCKPGSATDIARACVWPGGSGARFHRQFCNSWFVLPCAVFAVAHQAQQRREHSFSPKSVDHAPQLEELEMQRAEQLEVVRHEPTENGQVGGL